MNDNLHRVMEIAEEIKAVVSKERLSKLESTDISVSSIEFKDDREFKLSVFQLVAIDHTAPFNIVGSDYETRTITVRSR